MPGVHHFSNGVAKIKYLTAREFNTILRVWDNSLSDYEIELTNHLVSATTAYWSLWQEQCRCGRNTCPAGTCMCAPAESFSGPYVGHPRTVTATH
jgi:hypothetical protein